MLKDYEKAFELRKDCEAEGYDYLAEQLKKDYTIIDRIKGNSLEEKEITLFLENFVNRDDMKKKAVVRNLERYKKGELQEGACKKILTSLLTHLYIEQDKDEVPQSTVDWLIELLSKSLDDKQEFCESLELQ